MLAPSVREMEYRESYLEGEVLARAQREYLHRVPVTPKESAAWVGLCVTALRSAVTCSNSMLPPHRDVWCASPQAVSLCTHGRAFDAQPQKHISKWFIRRQL